MPSEPPYPNPPPGPGGSPQDPRFDPTRVNQPAFQQVPPQPIPSGSNGKKPWMIIGSVVAAVVVAVAVSLGVYFGTRDSDDTESAPAADSATSLQDFSDEFADAYTGFFSDPSTATQDRLAALVCDDSSLRSEIDENDPSGAEPISGTVSVVSATTSAGDDARGEIVLRHSSDPNTERSYAARRSGDTWCVEGIGSDAEPSGDTAADPQASLEEFGEVLAQAYTRLLQTPSQSNLDALGELTCPASPATEELQELRTELPATTETDPDHGIVSVRNVELGADHEGVVTLELDRDPTDPSIVTAHRNASGEWCMYDEKE